jgi:hypothetical protein
MRKAGHLLLLLVIIATNYTTVRAQPHGIYVLDNNQGTFRDANIRSNSFVDGFVWRTSWSDMETSQGVYDFSGLDHIVKHLDTIDKKLTILFGAYSVEPAYIGAHIGSVTYSFIDPVSSVATTRAVPYDAYLMQHYRLFVATLANHLIYSKATGTMVALKDHPVLANIATNIPGLGAIRSVNGTNMPFQNVMLGYVRTKFADSIVTAMKVQTDYFPTKNVFIPIYKNTIDNIASPSLAVYLRTQLLVNFNGVINPKISFWQENLAGYRDASTNVFTGLPVTTFATPLYQLNDSAYTMFQMLQGWTTPFSDPAKTANATPFDAMCYAYNTYGTSYYEVYVSDIDNSIYQSQFAAWDTAGCNTPLIIPTIAKQQFELTLQPNPAKNTVTIKGLQMDGDIEIRMFDMYGRQVSAFRNTTSFNIEILPAGAYYLRVNAGGATQFLKLIKQ